MIRSVTRSLTPVPEVKEAEHVSKAQGETQAADQAASKIELMRRQYDERVSQVIPAPKMHWAVRATIFWQRAALFALMAVLIYIGGDIVNERGIADAPFIGTGTLVLSGVVLYMLWKKKYLFAARVRH